ncbi:hypothetical protein HPB47_006155 [Ixodes persulcatus]|uniref:Uncharacterized protein n=1 Tax=Ixodes persulcatus TaxID=34615 RepID=A0AC60PB37_IXOPE|nr:hypothetical protein HPB47_006155 [Ixodes persulcatus]
MKIKKAATSGAHMVCLPACFGYPIGGRGFKASAETIPGETSEMLSKLTTFDTPFCKVGVGVCYDIHFAAPDAHLRATRLQAAGVSFRVQHDRRSHLPRVTPEVYVALASPARSERTPYVPWGHSMLVDPLGKVVQSTGAEEAVLMGEVDLDHLSKVRKQMPIMKHHRNDLYDVIRVAGDQFSDHDDGDCGAA